MPNVNTQVDTILLRNESSGAVLSINPDTSHFLAHEINWGSVEGTHHTYSFVGQIGSYLTGTTIGPRDISIIGWVYGSDCVELSRYKQTLNMFFSPLTDVTLVYDDYMITFRPDTSVKYSREFEENNDVFCKWEVTGEAPDPLWWDADPSLTNGANVISTLHFPLIVGVEEQTTTPPVDGKQEVVGYFSPSTILRIYNSGAIETGVRIELIARNTVVNPQILDIDTQEFVKINKTLLKGEMITYDSNMGQKVILGRSSTDTEYVNYYKYKDPDSSWLTVKPGANFFRYSAEDGEDNLEVKMYFYNRYLEVEVAHEQPA